MRYALIDNSSLTGVQRLLGQIPIKNTLVTDMDILCLESLVEAILFYDKVFVIDDYKPHFRESRNKIFPFIHRLGADLIPIQELTAKTKNLTEGIVPRVEAGQFTDQDFKPFFDLLRMNVTFTWDMSSSVYFLTQKMLAGVGGLDLEKYSQLTSAIYSELVDKGRSIDRALDEKKVILVDSRGKIIGQDYEVFDKEGRPSSTQLSNQASAFFASLNWLAFRTIFYTLGAQSLGIDLFLHPIRHAFQANLMPRLFRENISTFRPILDAMNGSANDSINKILGKTQPFVTKQKIPLFVTWLAIRTGDPSHFIEAAHELREESSFVEARKRLIALESSLADASFTTEANKLLEEVNKAVEAMIPRYGVSTNQGISLSGIITAWNLVATALGLPNIPSINRRIPQLEFLKHVVPQKGFKALYRALMSDLVEVSRLGKYHEVISSKIVLDDEGGRFLDKEERAEFQRQKSSWKIPM